MLWRKAWIESRWRFLIGLGILAVIACGPVFEYPAVQQLLPLAREKVDAVRGPLGRVVAEAVEIERDFRGYVWLQWFRQNLAQVGTLFAAILGSGGVIAAASGGAAVFTLSLPVSRAAVMAVRSATGLLEWLALAFGPSFLIPLLAPAIGERYSVSDTVIHSACAFVGGAVFFSLAIFLSTIFADLWRPLLLTCAVALAVAIGEAAAAVPGIFSVMSGARYFRTGQLPWIGLIVAAIASAALLAAAARNIERRDF